MADLYHFATKEDTYANYFIHVSPRLGFNPSGGRGPLRDGGREGSALDPERGSASPTPPGGAPLSPQLMEIQADYHRKSLSSLDTALAELRENHSQAGGDTVGPQPHTPDPHRAQGMLRSLHSILKSDREPQMRSEQGRA